MKRIEADNYPILFDAIASGGLEKFLGQPAYKNARKFVIVDENTLKSCFSYIVTATPCLADAEVIELESGERNKNINICIGVWEALTELEAERGDIIINLGGGVIGDMGGFIAATYKRGMRFIQVPTTLLAQVDASVGGKLGVDLNHFKNLVGVIQNPEAVFIEEAFLKTLHTEQLISGLAEMFKHGLVADAVYWKAVSTTEYTSVHHFAEHVYRSVEIKNEIVSQDPHEHGVRKLLNFGHTVGHALEAYSHESEFKSLLHGEAIGIGMICEAFLSYNKKYISELDLEDICAILLNHYPKFIMNDMSYHRVIEFMKNDKKNKGGSINFTLLKSIGEGVIDETANVEEITEALNYYQSLITSNA